jgi:hypothetical protein
VEAGPVGRVVDVVDAGVDVGVEVAEALRDRLDLFVVVPGRGEGATYCWYFVVASVSAVATAGSPAAEAALPLTVKSVFSVFAFGQ